GRAAAAEPGLPPRRRTGRPGGGPEHRHGACPRLPPEGVRPGRRDDLLGHRRRLPPRPVRTRAGAGPVAIPAGRWGMTDGMNDPAGGDNPFVGPRSIPEGMPLFGRDRETRDLYRVVVADRVVLLHSPSGAGKSSLVNAGLIRLLKRKRFRVWPIVRVNTE